MGGLSLLYGFPFPCSHFVFWIGSCFCPRNFVPCNALTSSLGLAACLALLGSCLFVACSPYSGWGVLPSLGRALCSYLFRFGLVCLRFSAVFAPPSVGPCWCSGGLLGCSPFLQRFCKVCFDPSCGSDSLRDCLLVSCLVTFSVVHHRRWAVFPACSLMSSHGSLPVVLRLVLCFGDLVSPVAVGCQAVAGRRVCYTLLFAPGSSAPLPLLVGVLFSCLFCGLFGIPVILLSVPGWLWVWLVTPFAATVILVSGCLGCSALLCSQYPGSTCVHVVCSSISLVLLLPFLMVPLVPCAFSGVCTPSACCAVGCLFAESLRCLCFFGFCGCFGVYSYPSRRMSLFCTRSSHA